MKENKNIFIYRYLVFTTEGFFEVALHRLVWVGFEPTTSEYHSEALTDWPIRQWVQRAFRANFMRLYIYSNFIFLKVSNFISALAFVSSHVYLIETFVEITTWVRQNEHLHNINLIVIYNQMVISNIKSNVRDKY